jgi:hypothetical protein
VVGEGCQKGLKKYITRLYLNRIGFCGKVYTFIHIYIKEVKMINKEFFAYNFEDLEDFMREYVYPFDKYFKNIIRPIML